MPLRANRKTPLPFADRAEAGRVLGTDLMQYANRPDVVVLGLPRGGVPVAFEVAHALRAPLHPFVVRKLGVPGREELALGAIAAGGLCVVNASLVRMLGLSEDAVAGIVRRAKSEVERRAQLYYGGRPLPNLHNAVALVVDDGLATGATMRVAVAALRGHQPARIVVAVPVGAPDTCRELESEADAVVCAARPEPFVGVGHWYADFAQTNDAEVQVLLERRTDEADAR
ncbi:MAG: phosphoribosyltransferase [Candidatus Baltobacteraceae bacterium]